MYIQKVEIDCLVYLNYIYNYLIGVSLCYNDTTLNVKVKSLLVLEDVTQNAK